MISYLIGESLFMRADPLRTSLPVLSARKRPATPVSRETPNIRLAGRFWCYPSFQYLPCTIQYILYDTYETRGEGDRGIILVVVVRSQTWPHKYLPRHCIMIITRNQIALLGYLLRPHHGLGIPN